MKLTNTSCAGLVIPCAILSMLFLTSCSQGPQLAVDKMPREQMQATTFLALNEDNPGVPLELERFLVPGKYTIVHFYSPYLSQCVYLNQRLPYLPQQRPEMAVRTVNINRPGVQAVDWQSPIMQNSRIPTLPYIQIYEPSGRLRAHARPAFEQVSQWVQALPSR